MFYASSLDSGPTVAWLAKMKMRLTMLVGGTVPVRCNMELHVNCDQWGDMGRQTIRTDRARTSAGVDTVPWASSCRKHVFNMFLIRGASWRLPFVRCRAGTGWYVLRAVFISGKTGHRGD